MFGCYLQTTSRSTEEGASRPRVIVEQRSRRWKGCTVANRQSPRQSAIAFFLFILVSTVLLTNTSFSQSGGSGQLTTNPHSLSLTAVAADSSQTRQLVVTNASQRRLVISDAEVNGTVFKLSTPTLPLTLAAGASASFDVTFSPATSGAFKASVVISYRIRSGGVSRSLTIAVSGTGTGSAQPAVLKSITVSPTSATISAGETQQFTATGHYSDNSTQNLTATATWTSSNSKEASISTGLATGSTAGTVTITASSGGVSSPGVRLTVTAAPVTLQSIVVTPSSATISAGETQQFTATGDYSDNSTQNLTASATWTSSNSKEASISAGLATGVAAGTATITASQGGLSSPGVSLVTTPPAAPSQSSGACSVMSTGQNSTLNGFRSFSSDSLWNADVSSSPVDPNSEAIINAIGSSIGLHPDFGSGLYDGSTMGIPYVVVKRNTSRGEHQLHCVWR